MQAKPERGPLPGSEPGRRRAPHHSRTRVASRTAAALCRFETRSTVPSNPARRPSIRPLPTLDLGLWTLDLRLRTATPASWPSLPGCGAKRPCRSSGLRRGCRSARPKGPSPCSLIWLRAKTNAKPQAPSNPAPNSNSNLRLTPAMGWSVKGNRVVSLFFSFFRFPLLRVTLYSGSSPLAERRQQGLA